MTKTLTVVGAGPGLGAAIAQRFGACGYSIGLITRRAEVLAELGNGLTAAGISWTGATADVSAPNQLRAALDRCAAELGEPDVVVSNTSMLVEALPTQVSLEVFETTWRVACLSTVVALQHVAPGMIRRGSGAFLLPGTALAVKPWAPGAALGAAKAAARNFVLAAHDELAPAGVQAGVITIMGMVKTGGAFDPAHIAGRFWQVANAAQSDWQPEVLFTG